MKLFEIGDNSTIINDIVSLSQQWENEDISNGYLHNELTDIVGNRIFVAVEENETLGYLFGKMKQAENISSIIPDNAKYFEIEEFYVKKDFRSQGIGRQLFDFVENQVKIDGSEYLFLNSATKNYKAVLRFYIDVVDMNFACADLFKKI